MNNYVIIMNYVIFKILLDLNIIILHNISGTKEILLQVLYIIIINMTTLQ